MFRPNASKTDRNGQNIPQVRNGKLVDLTVVTTAAGTEVRQVFADWLTQVTD